MIHCWKKPSLPDLVRAFEGSGCRGLELAEWWNWDLLALKELALSESLKMVCCGVKDDARGWTKDTWKLIENLDDALNAADTLDAQAILLSVPEVALSATRSEVDRLLAEMVTIIRSTGKVLWLRPAVNGESSFDAGPCGEVFDMVRRVDSPDVRFVFDIRQEQLSQGNLEQRIRANVKWIGHFHAASVPGNIELWDGEIDFEYLCYVIDETEFSGYLGLNYQPAEEPELGIDEAVRMLAHLAKAEGFTESRLSISSRYVRRVLEAVDAAEARDLFLLAIDLELEDTLPNAIRTFDLLQERHQFGFEDCVLFAEGLNWLHAEQLEFIRLLARTPIKSKTGEIPMNLSRSLSRCYGYSEPPFSSRLHGEHFKVGLALVLQAILEQIQHSSEL